MLELMSLRASQINGCGVCAVQHPRIAGTLGETDERCRPSQRVQE
jgi:AhpD family alkylhydroperoxidase